MRMRVFSNFGGYHLGTDGGHMVDDLVCVRLEGLSPRTDLRIETIWLQTSRLYK